MSAINQLCNSKKYLNFFIQFVGVVLVSFTTNYSYAQCGAGDVGGTVFLDLPMNGSSVGVYGTKATNEPGVGGITVKITDSNGTITTKTTDATGKWYLDAPVFPVKIEFLWKTTYPAFESSPNGVNSKTSVQIINSATCSADFALHNPYDYSQFNPNIVTTCFANGTSTGTAGTDAAIVSVKYNSTGLNAMYNNYLNVPGTGPMPNMDATINKVGSVYGVAYQRNKKRGFYSTFLKRHVGILDGTGYIYVLDHSTTPATYATKFNLQGLTPSNSPATTIDFGSVCRTAACGAIASDYTLPTDKTQPSVDLDAFGKVGRVSMGDIDLGPDNNTLFVTNLNSNSIITVDVSGTSLPGTVKEYKVATLSNYPTSTKGSLHIFALEFHNGKGYLGVTDDASISKLDADLKCYVLEFDPTNIAAGFIQKLVFNPNARKTVGNTQFHYWINSYVEPPVVDDGYFLRYTQPILSDIEFDQYGTMYLTLMDRFGHQIGQANHKPISGNTEYQSTQSFGELLKACDTSTGYVLEGNTGCAVTASEFFDDTSGDCSIESIVGSSLLLKGSDQIINTNFDPFSGTNCGQSYWNTQGFSTRSTTLGTVSNWYSVYFSGDTQLFGKANGLGDLEILASEAPIEIGNRIWKDTNEDGIQDPSEPSLVGVTIKLHNSSDVEIASTTTDANGQYIFSSTTVAALLPNTNYKIKVTSLGTNASVTGLSLTNISPAQGETAGNTNTGTTTDNSDAFLVSNIPTILIQTADAGENNHTYDFGFKCKPTANAGADKALNCTTTSTTIGTAAVAGNTYAWSPTTSLSSSTVANPTANPSVTTTYTLTVTSAAGCTSTDVVVVSVNTTAPTASITGTNNLTCATTSVTRTAAGGGTYLWSNNLGTNAAATITSAGVYTVTVTNTNGCTATATTNVTANSTVPNAGPDQNLSCGTSTTIRATSPLIANLPGGTWSSPTSTSILYFQSTNDTTYAIITAKGVYPIVYTLNGCSDTLKVTFQDIVPSCNNLWDNLTLPLSIGISTLNTPVYGTVLNASAIGGETDVTNTLLAGGGAGNSADISSGTISWNNGPGDFTKTVFSWDGIDNSAAVLNPTGLGGMNFSGAGNFGFIINSVDVAKFKLTLRLYTDASNISESYFTMDKEGVVNSNIPVEFTNFTTTAGTGANLSNIGAIELILEPKNLLNESNGIDFNATCFHTPCLVCPTPVASSTATCVGGTLSLTASGGSNYSWAGPNGFTSTLQNPSRINATTTMSGNYTVTVTSNGCTAKQAITNVIVTNTAAMVSEVSCHNNGTLSANTDDYITFLLTPSGNVGERFTLSATQGGNPVSVTLSNGNATGNLSYAYPTPLRLPIGTAGKGNITLTLTDTKNPSCTSTVTVVDPGTCIVEACNATPQTVTYSYRIPFQSTELNQVPLNIPKFDNNGGNRTLTKAQITYGISEATSGIIENTSASQSNITLTMDGSESITLGSTVLKTGTISYNTTQTVAPGIIVPAQGAYVGDSVYTVFSTNRYSTVYRMNKWLSNYMDDIYFNPTTDSRWVTNATGNTTHDDDIYVIPVQSFNLTDETVYTSPTDLSQFIGTGNLPLTASTENNVSMQETGGNNIFSQRTKAYAYATVTYTYICYNCTQPVVGAITSSSPACVGNNITLSTSGGNNYAWAGPNGFSSTSQNPTISNATLANSGTYTVTVSNGIGCSATATIALTVDTLPTAGITGTTNLTCSTTSVTRTATGGGTYSWSNGLGTNASVTITSAGTYTVTVTNSNGCTATATTSVTIDSSVPTVSISGSTNLTCSTTSVTRTASGGGSYLWSNGLGTNAIATISTAGTYTVTVTSANGCTATATTTVSSDSTIPQPTIASAERCGEGILTLSASGCDGTYNWYSSSSSNSSLATTASFTTPVISTTTLYYVSCTIGSCTSSHSVATATINEVPTGITASSNTPIKEGNSLNLTSTSTGGTSYSWTGPNNFTSTSQNPVINNSSELNEGIYTVTVNSNKGCSATATTQVTVFNLTNLPICTTSPTVSANSNSPVVAGNAINLTSVSSNVIDYLWSGPNGFTSNLPNPTITNASSLMSGIYTVLVTEDGLCSQAATTNVIITCLANPLASSNTPICAGSTLNLSASGGNSYAWSGPNNFTSTQQNPTISNAQVTAQGVYTVTLIGVNCTTTVTTNVVINPLPNAEAGIDKVINCTTSSVQIGSDAVIPNATYLWSPSAGLSATNASIVTATPTTTTTYTLTVTNNLTGCTATDAVIVTLDKNVPTAEAGIDKVINCTTSSVQIGSDAVIPNATYLWSPSAGLSATNTSIVTATPTTTTTYTLTVTNNQTGCTATDAVIVTLDKNVPTAEAGIDKVIDCTTSSVQIGSDAVIPNATYLWSPSAGLSATNTSIVTATPTTTTTYTLTVTNNQTGCTATDAVVVTVDKAPPIASITGTNNLTCTASSVTRVASGGGSYLWSNNLGTSATATISAAGTYTVTVTSENGCTATATTIVTVDTGVPTVTITATEDTLTCTKTQSILTTDIAPAGTYTYLWSNGSTASNISVNDAGTYSVEITAANGCKASASVVIVEFNTVTAQIDINDVDCKGGSTGKITVTGFDGIAPYKYKLNTGVFQSNNIFSALTAGTYAIAIQDAGGCTASISVSVKEPLTNVALTLTPTNLKCNGATDGQIQAVATGGTPEYSFAVNGGAAQSNSLFTNLIAGTYTITATDTKGCSITATTQVTQPTKLAITAIGSTIDCSTPKGTVTATVTGGTPTYQYSIDGTNFQASNSFANLNGGTYTITVKDQNLCVGTVTAAITVADTVKPTFTSAVATVATCTADEANTDGKITISGIVNGAKYQYSVGNTFNGAAAIPVVAANVLANRILISSLPNPSANSQFYTIRIFNSNGCYKDVTVELLKRVCNCKPEICVPVLINKTKSK